MRKIIAAALVGTFLAACMGDGTVVVTGQLQSESGMALKGCNIQRLAPSGAKIYDTSAIEPAGFSQDFVVAPRKEEYPLLISCAGHEPHRSSVRYIPGATEHKALGTVVLRVQRHGT